jgi:glycosyltransferase involved in cell wall biosynthesis
MAHFFIVVPTYNSEKYLERCLASIFLVQPGRYSIHVHVQDNASTDGTLKIVEAWKDKGVTFASEPDQGLYDALSKATKNVVAGQIMSWLGSDDMLMSGVLATIAAIFEQLPQVSWISGMPYIGDDEEGGFPPWLQMRFSRKNLTAGLHEGRKLGFVMQEGTFWRSDLWIEIGGIDQRFRLAGDWDLWRRFASKTPLYLLDFPTARFTQRKGQASSDLASYYAEIDASPPSEPADDENFYRLTRAPGENWKIEILAPARPGWRQRFRLFD